MIHRLIIAVEHPQKPRVVTPFPAPKIMDLPQFQGDHKESLYWGTYRPNVYLGIRARYTMVPASLYLGFSASIIWVAEGTYLTSTACSHAHDLNLEEGNVIGNFNGEFWGMFADHQGGTTSGSGTTLLYIVFVCSMTLGNHTRASYKRGMLKERRLYQILLSVSALPLFDLRMLLIIPLIAYSGLQQAFVWAECTKYIAEPALGESGVGGAMAAYGAFDAIVSMALQK
ncbi:hypothetical protein HYC85_024188 [Camellia sinensis]|uniref:Glycosyl hydrolase family 63 N-terminal domain-containing protein n=1 Tax=Camellia sinensis TaxID=4442 RepID=A0A7J7G7E6_CAMSI|nr:hypothetical protein HYC85_024188 [Camellia sinensis]